MNSCSFFHQVQAAKGCKGLSILWRCNTISELMINEQIRDKEVRLIGAGWRAAWNYVCKRSSEALLRRQDLILVKIAPTAKPPVCKIIDYGKYRYELARKEKEAKEKTESQLN